MIRRERYKPRTFDRTFRAGESADFGGMGGVTFLEPVRVRFTVPGPMDVTFFGPDGADEAAETIPMSQAG